MAIPIRPQNQMMPVAQPLGQPQSMPPQQMPNTQFQLNPQMQQGMAQVMPQIQQAYGQAAQMQPGGGGAPPPQMMPPQVAPGTMPMRDPSMQGQFSGGMGGAMQGPLADWRTQMMDWRQSRPDLQGLQGQDRRAAIQDWRSQRPDNPFGGGNIGLGAGGQFGGHGWFGTRPQPMGGATTLPTTQMPTRTTQQPSLFGRPVRGG